MPPPPRRLSGHPPLTELRFACVGGDEVHAAPAGAASTWEAEQGASSPCQSLGLTHRQGSELPEGPSACTRALALSVLLRRSPQTLWPRQEGGARSCCPLAAAPAAGDAEAGDIIMGCEVDYSSSCCGFRRTLSRPTTVQNQRRSAEATRRPAQQAHPGDPTVEKITRSKQGRAFTTEGLCLGCPSCCGH